LAKANQIEPFVGSSSQRSVVEIESVYVNVDLGHAAAHKRRKSQKRWRHEKNPEQGSKEARYLIRRSAASVASFSLF